MSVTTNTAKVQYTLSSAVQALPITFYFLDNSHIKAIRARTGAVDLVLTLGTDYTLVGAGDEAGGTLTTIATNLQAGDKITIKRDIPITQLTNYVYNDKFPAEVHEKVADKLTMAVQQLKEVTDRAVQFPESEVAGAGNIMPNAAGRASKIFGFDATGNAVQLYDPVSVVFASGDAIYANTVAALKAVSVAALLNGQQAHVAGYASVGDGGGGLWAYVSASAATENVGTIVAPNVGAGRWFRVYSGFASAKWFGAVGDGLTDDTLALQAAIDSVLPIFVPPGTYKITAALDLTDGETSFVGVNKKTCIIKQFTNNTPVLKVGGFGLRVSDLTLTYNTAQVAASTSANALEIYAMAWGELERIHITKCARGMYIPQTAVYLGANWIFSCRIRDIYVAHYTLNGIHLLAYSGGISGNVMENLYLMGRDEAGVASNTEEGLYLGGWSDGVINQLNIESTNPTEAIYLNTCKGIVINALHFEQVKPRVDSGGFVNVSADSVLTINGVSITYCTINTATAMHAFRVSGAGGKIIVKGLYEANNTITSPIWRIFSLPGTETGCLCELQSGSYSGFTGTGYSASTPTKIIRINDAIYDALGGSLTYNPPSLLDGEGVTTTVAVAGAAMGDFVQVGFSLDLQGITVTAYVSVAGTVAVRFQNETGGTIDLGNGTLSVRVRKQ